MPTYVCCLEKDSLSEVQKRDLAKAVVDIHSSVTGAPSFFAQVVFHEVLRGDYFLGGYPLRGPHVFIHGYIRAGRSKDDKTKLISNLGVKVSEITSIPSQGVFVYISELPARQMLEFGHILPEPGDEDEWFANLSNGDREHMISI